MNHAIDRGVQWLLGEQELDGSWRFMLDGYRNGQTALCVYTLLKSGVEADHPALQRALAFLRSRVPAKTYDMSVQLIALCEIDAPEDRARIEELVQILLSWQDSGFAYPDGTMDLSNTQYAALALRAAAKRGVKVPEKHWGRMADYTLKTQREVKNPYAAAGFGYRIGTPPTASMTCAGIAVLKICEEHLIRGRPDVRRGIDQGMRWLAEHYSVSINANEGGDPEQRWLYYYLYGLERVGGLLSIAEIGGYDWYRDGARYLVERQKSEGSWGSPYAEEQPNTCFALLFLNRATAPSTGERVIGARTYGSDDEAEEVSLRASGDAPLAVWVSSFGKALRERLEWKGEEGKGPRVVSVTYHAKGERPGEEQISLGSVEGAPHAPSGAQRFGVSHTFARSGEYEVWAELRFLAPGGRADRAEDVVVVRTRPLPVEIVGAPDPKLMEYAADATRNLMLETRVDARASSHHGGDWLPELATDGLQGRAWLSRDDDPRPSLDLTLAKPQRANALLLSHAITEDDQRVTRIRRLEVTINGKNPHVIEMLPDDRRKTEWTFPEPIRVRRISLRVLETSPPEGNKAAVGLAEVELQLR